MRWRNCFRRWFRIRLSTWIVAMITASALVGINVRPFAFYVPRPPWVEELKYFVIDQDNPVKMVQCGLYGWPAPAFPSWNWCGNDVPEGRFPEWGHFSGRMAHASIACNWEQWNNKALIVDGVANALVFMLVMGGWLATRSVYERWMKTRAGQKNPTVAEYPGQIVH